MYLSEFIESLALYGLPAVVMSVLAEGCTLLLVRLCRIQNTALKNILPFLFGVAFSCLYSLIFQGAGSVFTEETLYTGILCGSLSTVYGAILNRTLSKKAEPDRESIVIGQLNGFVRPEELSDTAKAICAALEEGAGPNRRSPRSSRRTARRQRTMKPPGSSRHFSSPRSKH